MTVVVMCRWPHHLDLLGGELVLHSSTFLPRVAGVVRDPRRALLYRKQNRLVPSFFLQNSTVASANPCEVRENVWPLRFSLGWLGKDCSQVVIRVDTINTIFYLHTAGG